MKLKHSSKILEGAETIKRIGIITIDTILNNSKLDNVWTNKLSVEKFRKIINDSSDDNLWYLIEAISKMVEGAAFLEDCDIELKLKI